MNLKFDLGAILLGEIGYLSLLGVQRLIYLQHMQHQRGHSQPEELLLRQLLKQEH